MANPYPVYPQHATVIGAGAWGTTLAWYLARKGLQIALWAYEADVAETVRLKRENIRYLPGVTLPDTITPHHDMTRAVEQAEFLVLAVPSHVMRAIVHQLAAALSRPRPLILATKGIEEGSLKLMSQVVSDILSPDWISRILVLTGPSFAREVCQSKPTTILLAGVDPQLTAFMQTLFLSPTLRVYTGSDLIGAQLGGALKNVIAIAAGLVDGLELGYNARAALITRGLAEMIRLGRALGAEVHTFYGLSGLGDLILTCTGPLSRNYTVGVQLGKGSRLDEILSTMVSVAEGIRTARAAVALARNHAVEMPIVENVAAVLFEGKSPHTAVTELMTRAAKAEFDLLHMEHL
ncbi:MAG: NAD(P)-dependent glycerol-3-phosphate dehydrogenase [Nitrospirae bacterium]|nr:MAG: NAD(P)-dependent glycerol-3-phosphate dehydrogenase [Nitrospirota bacterium]